MNCPKCGGKFELVSFRDVEVDRCTVCAGIWFDFAEREELKDMVSSEMIDTGNILTGQELNEKRDIRCPVCEARMIPLTDKQQTHIEYEVCPKCYGLFFDAGEFTDDKEFTLTEKITQWFESKGKS